ncbi:hypothetical protein PVAP13_1NG273800 [Panicum virgatum]|uniref:Uncharacterized protein n=1 Tax=Panicum virgatum TaxID=38727 RepID=A0A8T0WWT2_PANVG|nr:hypothetical protein PVAP13_1NG273800 [Panicum virgatum]KAG2651248.1 hypothetical protein PVAP13_1NG273800 [Panicum virgatum]
MAGACSLLVLLVVALAGGASTAVAFSGADNMVNNNDGVAAPALLTPKPPSPGEVNSMMGCLMGCFTQVFSCALGCMGKGPDLPLCVVSCDQKSIVCMIRCALSPSPGPSPPKPSPPGPKPPGPKPPAPKPPAPKPPAPAPPGPPPHAATGRKTATSA